MSFVEGKHVVVTGGGSGIGEPRDARATLGSDPGGGQILCQ